jgi:hypothetical protein
MLKDNDFNTFILSKNKDDGRAILEDMFDEEDNQYNIIVLKELLIELCLYTLHGPSSTVSIKSGTISYKNSYNYNYYHYYISFTKFITTS